MVTHPTNVFNTSFASHQIRSEKLELPCRLQTFMIHKSITFHHGFAPITGGRVSDIIRQESKRSGQKRSAARNKIEKFYEDYKDFIDVNDAHEKFMSIWNSK
jgi:hypothetical protein